MAPIAGPPTANGSYDGSASRFDSLQSWLGTYGQAEYALYKKTPMAKHLTYEEWASSEHVLGPYLYHTTLDVWEEDTSSDGNSDLEAVKLVSPDLPKRGPTKTVTTNSRGMSRAAKTSTPATVAKANDPSTSAKRRRRQRKKYLSEEIVASDDSDEAEEFAPLAKTEAPATSVATEATTNGRRKSSGRKPRRKFLSEENISPEDLEDDTMSIDDVVTSAAPAAIPIRSGPNTPAKTTTTKPAKREPTKTGSGRKPRKKYLSEATVPIDDEEESDPAADGATPNNNTAANSATASPDEPGTSESASAKRRGLRVRTPAQQRPYFHHAKLFEEQEDTIKDPESGAKLSPSKGRATKLVQVSYPDEELEDLEDLDDESMAMLQDEEPSKRKPKHFKGKGRAWKKDDDDEDLDYGSPMKSKVPKQTKPKRRGRPRKQPQLSEVFIKDDSDAGGAEEKQDESSLMEAEPTIQAPPKRKGRPRKSDQSAATSRASLENDENEKGSTPGYENLTPRGKPEPKKAKPSSVSIADVEAYDEKGGKEDQEDGRNEEVENQQALVSPLHEVRKRKSGGSDGSYCEPYPLSHSHALL